MPEPAGGLSRHSRPGPRWDAPNLRVEQEARVPQIRAINRALCLMNPGMPCPAAPTISLSGASAAYDRKASTCHRAAPR